MQILVQPTYCVDAKCSVNKETHTICWWVFQEEKRLRHQVMGPAEHKQEDLFIQWNTSTKQDRNGSPIQQQKIAERHFCMRRSQGQCGWLRVTWLWLAWLEPFWSQPEFAQVRRTSVGTDLFFDPFCFLPHNFTLISGYVSLKNFRLRHLKGQWRRLKKLPITTSIWVLVEESATCSPSL